MKTQKGITLIALIITIIVMLILVGVSVSVALNTGLFTTAQGAAKNIEAAKENETKLSSGIVTIYDEEGNPVEKTINEIVYGTGEESPIYLSENPTHILNIDGKQYMIDTETIWSEFSGLDDWEMIQTSYEWDNVSYKGNIVQGACTEMAMILKADSTQPAYLALCATSTGGTTAAWDMTAGDGTPWGAGFSLINDGSSKLSNCQTLTKNVDYELIYPIVVTEI